MKIMTNMSSAYRPRLNIVAIVALSTIMWSCNTANKIRSDEATSVRAGDSILVDSDGNRYLVKILRDNKLWMTTNLKLTVPGSYCYNDSVEHCERYGRLYTWESAQKGCVSLGEGWRLPSKDEWQQLAVLYGAEAKDSNEIRNRAYHPLLTTGNSAFNAQLGGGRAPDGRYARLEAHGFYWTTTVNDSSTAWFANFAKGSQSLYHQNDGEKVRAFSVRCIKSPVGK